jgi:hypothetical protein
VPDAPNQEQERREVSVYLASWQAANPGAEVSIVDEESARARPIRERSRNQSRSV